VSKQNYPVEFLQTIVILNISACLLPQVIVITMHCYLDCSLCRCMEEDRRRWSWCFQQLRRHRSWNTVDLNMRQVLQVLACNSIKQTCFNFTNIDIMHLNCTCYGNIAMSLAIGLSTVGYQTVDAKSDDIDEELNELVQNPSVCA
jgi:hypothetical protein